MSVIELGLVSYEYRPSFLISVIEQRSSLLISVTEYRPSFQRNGLMLTIL